MTISGVIDTPKAAALNTTSGTGSATSASGTKNANDIGADQDKFMKLLVTQLKNQDPLNPMDNAAMTSQLAQLSTVTGINKVNATLESLRTDQASAQSLTATNLIGKGVLVEGKGIELSSSTDAAGKTTTTSVFGIDLATAADSVTISIQDKTGATVRTMNMKATDIGTYPITWDGTTDAKTAAPAGSYTFAVKAVSGGKTLTDSTPLQLAAVASVSTGSGGVKLNTSLGQFAMSEVKEVL
ncbi:MULTISPECIES: flagellar hook assembly protein FlgD [unclassified Duganella]|uniref:flagellar hook assembly protein FlgD n=1 Tax=unclassified Duganella TaxID=2636909 RepID=UPI0008745D94|nr:MULTISPECIES: flagellar hook assembly protein FlgD [unclassified Duganella]OEZ53412.1 basal-body rod modification protein FlgD [Duganella sp. HH105]OFA04691.1 basal-body rod modification protein FlgD [Duganella sp. HH101]